MEHRKSTLEDMGMNAGFWVGKRVFLTGHTGFKGSWLSLWLTHLGAIVHGFALPPKSELDLFRIAGVDQLITSTIGNICDLGSVKAAMNNASADLVIHMAAQSLVIDSYKDPVLTFETNVMGTVNVLESARIYEVPVIVVTSDKCYQNTENQNGYVESCPMGGADPYSSSKACAELITEAYRRSYFYPVNSNFGVASVRAGNVIGGGDNAENRLVPDIVKAFQEKSMFLVRSPNAIRPWQHVLEPLYGYLILAENLIQNGMKFGSAWNFGPDENESWTVTDLLNEAKSIWGTGVKWSCSENADYKETSTLKVNSNKAKVELGWSPIFTNPERVRWTLEWFQQVSEGYDPQRVTMDQIRMYERLVRNGS